MTVTHLLIPLVKVRGDLLSFLQTSSWCGAVMNTTALYSWGTWFKSRTSWHAYRGFPRPLFNLPVISLLQSFDVMKRMQLIKFRKTRINTYMRPPPPMRSLAILFRVKSNFLVHWRHFINFIGYVSLSNRICMSVAMRKTSIETRGSL